MVFLFVVTAEDSACVESTTASLIAGPYSEFPERAGFAANAICNHGKDKAMGKPWLSLR